MAPDPDPDRHRVAGDGVELAAWEWGAGYEPTVVLVHGFPDTHAMWIPVAELLAARQLRVVAYDVRGAGASEAPTDLEGYRLDHLVADLRAVVDHASPEQPVHLVGHDWGSIQAWHALGDERLDGRIASYTSISGLPLDHASRWLRGRARQGRFLVLARQGVRSSYVGLFHVPGVAELARRSRRLLQHGRDRWASTLQRVDGAPTDPAWPAPTFASDVPNGMALYRANFRDRLLRRRPPRPSPVPVLIVQPTRDRFVPAWLFEGIEEVAPDVRRVEIDAHHWVPRSHPEELADLIAEHVARHPLAPV